MLNKDGWTIKENSRYSSEVINKVYLAEKTLICQLQLFNKLLVVLEIDWTNFFCYVWANCWGIIFIPNVFSIDDEIMPISPEWDVSDPDLPFVAAEVNDTNDSSKKLA